MGKNYSSSESWDFVFSHSYIRKHWSGHSEMPKPKPVIKMIGCYDLLEMSDILSLPDICYWSLTNIVQFVNFIAFCVHALNRNRNLLHLINEPQLHLCQFPWKWHICSLEHMGRRLICKGFWINHLENTWLFTVFSLPFYPICITERRSHKGPELRGMIWLGCPLGDLFWQECGHGVSACGGHRVRWCDVLNKTDLGKGLAFTPHCSDPALSPMLAAVITSALKNY